MKTTMLTLGWQTTLNVDGNKEKDEDIYFILLHTFLYICYPTDNDDNDDDILMGVCFPWLDLISMFIYRSQPETFLVIFPWWWWWWWWWRWWWWWWWWSPLQISDAPSEPEPRVPEAEGAPHLDAAAVPESVEVKARSVEAGGGGRVTSLARERGARGPGLGVPLPGVNQEGVPPRSSLE